MTTTLTIANRSNMKCSPESLSHCSSLIRVYKGECSDLSTRELIETVKRAARVIKPELNRESLPIQSAHCEGVIRTLAERKISPAVITLGYIFFFLIIPAVLAYVSSKNNQELDSEIRRLSELSALLKQYHPSQTLAELTKKADDVELFLTDIPPTHVGDDKQARMDASRPQTQLVTKRDERDENASSARADLVDILAGLSKLRDDHQALATVVPDSSLEPLPHKAMDMLRQRSLDLAPRVSASAASGLLSIEGDALSTAISARDLGLAAAQAKIAAAVSDPARILRMGINNGTNSCYAAAALQCMRFNPALRYLVDRELPSKSFTGTFSPDGLPVFVVDSPEYTQARKRVQAKLRALFAKLDSGVAVSDFEINDFRDFVGRVDLKFRLGTDALPPRARWNTRSQEDSAEFRVFLEDMLLMGTIQSPTEADKCFISGLQQEVVTESIVLPNQGFLEPLDSSVESKSSYVIAQSVQYQGRHSIAFTDLLFEGGKSTTPRIAKVRTNLAGVQGLMGFAAPITPDSYKIEIKENYNTQDAVALRDRLKEYDDGSCPFIMEKEAGVFYKIGGYFCRQERAGNNPPSLTFDVTRTVKEHPRDSGPGQKVVGPVPFPPFFERRDMSDASSARYEISSCVCHTGNRAGGGHYLAYIRVKRDWYYFSDGIVRKAEGFDPTKENDISSASYIRVR